ncbi:MAG TPA: universal stress protein [Longimicrobiales bacterium]
MQIRNIVVPLDGSRLAEHALPHACSIARRSDASVHVVAILPGAGFLAPAEVAGVPVDVVRQSQDELDAYLERVLARIRQEGYVRVTGEIRIGSPVDGIMRTMRDYDADLVTITTHARGGFRRAWFGSVTDELTRRTHVPLLVLKAGEVAPADLTREPAADAVVVPLDGSRLAEAAIEPALAFAALFRLPVTLLRVVCGPFGISPFVPVPPEAAGDLRDEAAGAEAYVEAVAAELRLRGAVVRTVVVHDDSIASAIAACGTGALTVMATHGLSGMQRMLLGSVADKVVRFADSPVVVVRPERATATPWSSSTMAVKHPVMI